MKQVLIPIAEAQNFRAGEPFRYIEYAQPCCICPDADYSGNDPAVQFPAGIHVRVGKGAAASGAFHQDCARFEANKDLVRVMPFASPNGATVNIIRLEGGSFKRPDASAYLTKPLVPEIAWAAGDSISTRLIFSPRSEMDAQLYTNFGLRGELAFEANNENVEVCEVAIRKDHIKVLYYRDAVDGDGGGSRRLIELPFDLALDRWYGLTVKMAADPLEVNTWALTVKLHERGSTRKVTWKCPKGDRPNRGINITALGTGDEHQGGAERPEMIDGGVIYIAEFSAYKVERHANRRA